MVKKEDFSRRSFVRSVGVGSAATAALAPGTKAAATVLPAKAKGGVVNYGLIGPGSRGYKLLQRHLKHIDIGRCVALCDIYEPNLAKASNLFSHEPATYTDYHQLLEQSDVEAIFITTPLHLHYPMLRDALSAGKHVFCEKSLVFQPEEVHNTRKLHKDYPNLVLQVGLQRRYSSFYSTAKEMINKGVIGKVTHIYAQWHRNTNWRRPVNDSRLEDQINWRLSRKYSGGLAAELMSHQVDVADWMIGATPKSVSGVGGLDYWKDGRDIYDNIQLIFEYPGGEKLLYSAISTNRHLEGRRLNGDGCREVIMGTDGSIEISLIPHGEGMWFRDSMKVKIDTQEVASEEWTAGATVVDTLTQGEGLPIIPHFRDLNSGEIGFVEKEIEFAKRWLYQKGILVPHEDRNPEYKELESFLLAVRDGLKPKAGVEIGLQDSVAVILANHAMDEERKVYFQEINAMGGGPRIGN